MFTIEKMTLFHGSQLNKEKVLSRINKKLIPTKHARKECLTDDYGIFSLPEWLPGNLQLLEVTIEGNNLKKVIVKYSENRKKDIVLVLLPKKDLTLIKTAWSNLKHHNPKPFSSEKYYVNPPEEFRP